MTFPAFRSSEDGNQANSQDHTKSHNRFINDDQHEYAASEPTLISPTNFDTDVVH